MTTEALVAELAKGAAPEPPAGRRALVVVDMQRHFLFPGGEGSNDSPNATAIANVAALADSLRAQDCPIVWVKTGRRKDRADSALPRLREAYLLSKGELLYDGTWGSELAPGLNPKSEDILVVKRGNSAFNFTPLHRILRNLGVSHCVVTGGATTGCLAATVRDGAALGYRFTVVSDAVYPAGSSYLKVFDDYGVVTPTAALLT